MKFTELLFALWDSATLVELNDFLHKSKLGLLAVFVSGLLQGFAVEHILVTDRKYYKWLLFHSV